MQLPTKASPMLKAAAMNGKGHKWYIETPIFFLVFLVSQILQTIPLTISIIVWMVTSAQMREAIALMVETGDMTQYINAVSELMKMPRG